MRVALGVEYDGAGFNGWQVQTGRRTVQHCLEDSIARVADHPVGVVTAGRTDSGVHATGQVVHFDTHARRDDYQWVQGINTGLPEDVTICWSRLVADDFHARFSAVERSYRYIVLNSKQPSALFRQRATWQYRPLDVSAMRTAGAVLLGEHDFSSFRAAGCQAKTPVRTVSSLHIERFDNWVCFDIVANAFLQHMVRNMVGSLMSIGVGDKSVEWLEEVLEACDRTRAGATAPATGLYLTSVRYPDRFDIPLTGTAVRYW